MADFMKGAVSTLKDIFSPLISKFSDPKQAAQFQQSIGYDPGSSAPPKFPSGSAMDTYLLNEDAKKDEILFALAIKEVGEIIDGLRGFYEVGADTWYAVSPDSNATRSERIQLAVSELLTLTINVFALDYVRLRYPRLHNVFLMCGVVDEMSQRAGGSVFIGKVIADNVVNFLKGFALVDDKSSNTTIAAMGLALNIVKYAIFKDVPLYINSGFETLPQSFFDTNPEAVTKLIPKLSDAASQSFLSAAWSFQKDTSIQSNLYLTLGLIPSSSPFGRGFVAKINAPASFEKTFGELFAFKVIVEGNLQFFYASKVEFDVSPGTTNRASLIFKFTPKPDHVTLLKAPELAIGYGNEHSIEFRFNHEEIGIIFNTALSIKFGKGTATSFPMGFIPESQYEDTLHLSYGWTTKRSWFINDGGTAGTPPAATPAPAAAAARSLPAAADAPPADESNSNLLFFNVPIKTAFAGLTFQNVHIGLGKNDKTTIIETSLDFTFVIAKAFAMSVTRLGARVNITPREDGKGFLGQDIDLKFKPPTGIGVTVDFGGIKGGGFLSLDDEKGEYMGAIELAVDLSFCKFNIKAFGMIQTKIPGAPAGEYSMFIVISSDFEPLPIFFNLTINGVGGLSGHNRTADVSLIQSEMRSPFLENILFLKDPIANISSLVTNAGRYFPVSVGSTVWGISLIIGFGNPNVFELRIAVIWTKGGEVIMVPGFLVLKTPNKSKIVKLQVNFLAVLDRKEEYFFFRADLVDSMLATFKLTGSLVFAMGWGVSDGLFAVSIGGFHPAYKNFPQIKALPNAFKGLDRLRLSLWEDGKDHLYLELYLAITSNSRQIGAHAYLHVNGPAGFNIDGHIGFDVLWETEPKCYFEASLEARIDFRHGDSVLAGVELKALFSGPTPKHIEGKAKLKICWFLSVSIPFSKTWGDPAPAIEDDSIDLDIVFREQVNDNRNWRAELPDFHHLHVTLKTNPNKADDEILVQPLGALVFIQRALPLNLEIQRIGSRKAKVKKAFAVNGITSNGNKFTDLSPQQELFAAGQYIDLKDNEKLSRASFEKMNAGTRIGDTGASMFPAPFVKARNPEYELSYIIPDLPARKKQSKPVAGDTFKRLSKNAAASKYNDSWQSGKGLRSSPQKLELKDQSYTIGGIETMNLFAAVTPGGYTVQSRTQAEQVRKQLLKDNPALKGKIQVLKNYELIN